MGWWEGRQPLFERASAKAGVSQVPLVAKNLLPVQEMQETWVRSLGLVDPLQEGMATHSSTLAGKSHGWRSLAGYSPWGRKESDVTE